MTKFDRIFLIRAKRCFLIETLLTVLTITVFQISAQTWHRSEGGWFSKYGMKLAGIGGGIGAVFFGFWSCFTIYPLCILAGILQICAGLLVIALEAPFVFFCVDFIPKMVAKVDGRPIWQKTLLYIVVAVLPLLLCFVPFTFIGSGFIFLVAIMYGMKVVGPKVSKEGFILQCLAKQGVVHKTMLIRFDIF